MKIFLFINILLVVNVCLSQNLVPNPSFEDYITCPSGSSQLTLAFPWTAPTNNDADYFHSCSPDQSSTIPQNAITFLLYPKSGDACAAIWTYNIIGPDYREYLQVQLESPLTSGNCYYISFYTVLSNMCQLSINSLSCNLSTSQVSSTGTGLVLNLSSDISRFNNKTINDTIDWVKISGIYNAIGGENYITIGNFQDDNNTNTISNSFGFYEGAYYFIDDVSVIPIDSLLDSMPAFAGNDVTISQEGDSAFIGQEISNLNCNWSILGGAQIATNTSGLFVQPTTTTTYVVEQTLCGTVSYDTVTVYVTVGLEELNELTNLEIYPNPTSGKVIVSSSNLTVGALQIFVMDVTGKEVYNAQLYLNEGISHFSLDVKVGSYFITLLNPITKEKTTRQLTVQK